MGIVLRTLGRMTSLVVRAAALAGKRELPTGGRAHVALDRLNRTAGVEDGNPLGPPRGFGQIAGPQRGPKRLALLLHPVEFAVQSSGRLIVGQIEHEGQVRLES